MKRLHFILFSGLSAAAFFPIPAFAAEKIGLPQFNVYNPLLMSQDLWAFVIFAVLYFALHFWLLPPIGKTLDQRKARIKADLDAAGLAKKETDKAVKELMSARHQIYADAQKTIQSATQAAKLKSAAEAAQLAEDLKVEQEKAEAGIKAAHAAAKAALADIAVVVTEDLATRILGRKPAKDTLESALTASSAEEK